MTNYCYQLHHCLRNGVRRLHGGTFTSFRAFVGTKMLGVALDLFTWLDTMALDILFVKTLQASASATRDNDARRCPGTRARGQWTSLHCERSIFWMCWEFNKFFGPFPRKHWLTVYRGLQINAIVVCVCKCMYELASCKRT